MSIQSIAQLFIDYNIDFLHDDKATLKNASLVHSTWLEASRFHLFEHLKVAFHEDDGDKLQDMFNLLLYHPGQTNVRGCHLRHYVKRLRLSYLVTMAAKTMPLRNILVLLMQQPKLEDLFLSGFELSSMDNVPDDVTGGGRGGLIYARGKKEKSRPGGDIELRTTNRVLPIRQPCICLAT